MKNILLILACALFVSTSAFAQLTENPGAVTVDVVKHLEINLDGVDVMFTYNEHGITPQSTNSDWNNVVVKANVDWKMDVVAVGGAEVLTHTSRPDETIPASLLTYYLTIIEGVVHSDYNTAIYPFVPAATIPPYGSLNAKFKMQWDLVLPTEGYVNLYAGDYKIGVKYILTEGTPGA